MARTRTQARSKTQTTLGLPRSTFDPTCQGIKKCGDRCTNRKKYGDFCGVHLPKEECPVCYDTKRCEKLTCGHGLCKGCSDQWFCNNKTCPMCRRDVMRTSKWTARRYRQEQALIRYQEEIQAFAQAYLTLRMEINPDYQAAWRHVEAVTPRNLDVM